jgi:hypothetical protein
MENPMSDTPTSRWVAWAGPQAAAVAGKLAIEAAWNDHTHKADMLTPAMGEPPAPLLLDGSLYGFGCAVAPDHTIPAPAGMTEIVPGVATGVLGR